MKSKEDKYGYVHRERYKQALDRIELLESRVRELYARMSVLLTIFNKVDAVGKESPQVLIGSEELVSSPEIYVSSTEVRYSSTELHIKESETWVNDGFNDTIPGTTHRNHS